MARLTQNHRVRDNNLDAFHRQWLGMAQPIDGLVFAKPTLLSAELRPPTRAPGQASWLEQLQACRRDAHAYDTMAIFTQLLRLGPSYWHAPTEAHSLAASDTGQVLTPTKLFGRPNEQPQALYWELPTGLAFDEAESQTGAWHYRPALKLERLMRHLQVPIGLLGNGHALRLIYAPHGGSTGALTFRFADMAQPSGKPLLEAMVMLLHERQWFAVAKPQQVPALLKQSRQAQGEVTTKLANQVRQALQFLLTGFAADAQRHGSDATYTLAHAYADRGGQHVYQGLLTLVLRLVTVLYAEDNGLLPLDHPLYARHYSLTALHDQLAADAGEFPDAMAHRHGAYGQVIALCRAIYYGTSHGALTMPPRAGELFDPDAYPFLQGGDNALIGEAQAAEQRSLPTISDETVYAVLRRLLVLGGERLSYKALNVEQIGSVYEALMGYAVTQLTGAAVCLKNTAWLSVTDALAQPPGGRSKWLQESLGVEKKLADTIAKALASCKRPAEALTALGKFAERDEHGEPLQKPADEFVIQPSAERAKSGSHYTPPELTGPIVRKTLAPLLAQLGPAPTAEQLLRLHICDPAMGSGAFLVEVVRQLADELVAAWQREPAAPHAPQACNAAPLQGELDLVTRARRVVAQRCIYGVDKNPHAVTLAKLSLWLVTMAKDFPFTFLDHCLRAGDSLVGASLDQLRAFHWAPPQGQLELSFISHELAELYDEAVTERLAILRLAHDDRPKAQRAKANLLRQADDAVERLRVVANALLGAFWSSDKDKARLAERQRRLALVQTWLAPDGPAEPRAAAHAELVALAQEFTRVVPAFHWQLEFPEVFTAKRADPVLARGSGETRAARGSVPGQLGAHLRTRRASAGTVARVELEGGELQEVGGRAWMDAFVGNPPFLGGSKISGAFGEPYLQWLFSSNAGAQGQSDYCAYFFRRCFELLGEHGTMGLVSTNTIGQGDTRATGVQYMVNHGGAIYDASKSKPWPGNAAVMISEVHVAKGACIGPLRMLDGIPVSNVNSRLMAGLERGDPVDLKANEGKSFKGSMIYGMGFVLTPEERDALIAKNKKNAERIFPYLGGEEVNTSPTHAFDRYVINFGDMTLEEAGRWPDLLKIVREKVKPERDALRDNSIGNKRRQFWWQYGSAAGKLYAALANLPRCLVTSQVTKHLCFSLQPTNRVLSENLVVLPIGHIWAFAVVQSRIHECWARLFSSTLEDRLKYAPSDCFTNFPFSPSATHTSLEALGNRLYQARAAFMCHHNLGLTQTYNQLKDANALEPAGAGAPANFSAYGNDLTFQPLPGLRVPTLSELRTLHEDLDRAVLAAYGWDDIAVPPFCPPCPETTPDAHAAWQTAHTLFSDTIIDRLFALNAARAAEESGTGGAAASNRALPADVTDDDSGDSTHAEANSAVAAHKVARGRTAASPQPATRAAKRTQPKRKGPASAPPPLRASAATFDSEPPTRRSVAKATLPPAQNHAAARKHKSR